MKGENHEAEGSFSAPDDPIDAANLRLGGTQRHLTDACFWRTFFLLAFVAVVSKISNSRSV